MLHMEHFTPQNTPEGEGNKNFNRHNKFAEAAKKFLGMSALVGSGILILTGAYEFFTGDKTGDLLHAYQKDLPDILNWAVKCIDAIPTAAKSSAGGSLALIAHVLLKSHEDSVMEKE